MNAPSSIPKEIEKRLGPLLSAALLRRDLTAIKRHLSLMLMKPKIERVAPAILEYLAQQRSTGSVESDKAWEEFCPACADIAMRALPNDATATVKSTLTRFNVRNTAFLAWGFDYLDQRCHYGRPGASLRLKREDGGAGKLCLTAALDNPEESVIRWLLGHGVDPNEEAAWAPALSIKGAYLLPLLMEKGAQIDKWGGGSPFQRSSPFQRWVWEARSDISNGLLPPNPASHPALDFLFNLGLTPDPIPGIGTFEEYLDQNGMPELARLIRAGLARKEAQEIERVTGAVPAAEHKRAAARL